MSKEFDEKFYNRFFVNLPFESKKRLYNLIMKSRMFDMPILEDCYEDTD